MVPFDPYLNWLGIPPHEQPVNYYRLLGLVLFESNPQTIVQAADNQSLRVGSYQSGPQSEMCQQLLSEIAMAQFCLLDPQQKAAYDAQLQGALAHRGERAVAAAPPPATGPFVPGPVPMPSGPMQSPISGMPMSGPPMPPPRPMPAPQPMMAAPPRFAPAMPAPAAIPVAAAFPAPMPKAAAAVAHPVATLSPPPAAPPSAPPRPIDELEALVSQPTRRRRLIGRKKKADYSRQMLIGGVVGVTGVMLFICYLAFYRPSGFQAIPAEIEKPTGSLRTKIAVEEEKERKKIAKEKAERANQEATARASAARTAAGERPKSDNAGPLRPFDAAAKDVKSNTGDDDGQSLPHVHDFGPPPRAMDSPAGGGRADANPPRGHDVTPDQLGSDDDPVMGKDGNVSPNK